MTFVYISLGSNLGNRLNHLRGAFDLLQKRFLKHATYSMVLETSAVLPEGAPASWDKPFLNMVVKGETDLQPEALLRGLKEIEHALGRPKEYERWAPRLIDLDILLWEGVTRQTPELTIPHPELTNRPFLLHLLALMGNNFHTNNHLFSRPFLNSFVLFPKFVGVVNITEESFSDGGLYNTSEKAIAQVFKLAEEGASVIEIGAQSTTYGATLHSPEEEYAILEPVLEALQPFMEDRSLVISVDTFCPAVIRKILHCYSIAWINDVTGELDDSTLKLINDHDCKLCIMHSLTVPSRKDVVIPRDRKSTDTVLSWIQTKVTHLLALGFPPENIIVDPGIGFGKTVYQNIALLQDIAALKKLGFQVLVGHSRKSYLEAFSAKEASQRDIETIAVSATLKKSADFLRVHNVSDHMRFLTIHDSLVQGKVEGNSRCMQEAEHTLQFNTQEIL
jgi:2-amino-4-hydroxy-6-hydroxymethyldihydropteridine diphosphokinase/dihydropteroate synthase